MASLPDRWLSTEKMDTHILPYTGSEFLAQNQTVQHHLIGQALNLIGKFQLKPNPKLFKQLLRQKSMTVPYFLQNLRFLMVKICPLSLRMT